MTYSPDPAPGGLPPERRPRGLLGALIFVVMTMVALAALFILISTVSCVVFGVADYFGMGSFGEVGKVAVFALPVALLAFWLFRVTAKRSAFNTSLWWGRWR
ncbi:MAG: hypothetical protein WCJ64_17270 [Rhodospirillaceae bacterium]